MTEQEWLACTDPQKMLEFLKGKASDRKLRLFACAFCRSVWHLLADGGRSRRPEHSRHAVEVAEWYADGDATAAELADAWDDAWAAAPPPENAPLPDAAQDADYAICCAAWVACHDAARGAGGVATWAAAGDAVGDAASVKQATLLRCIFGNPFHPVALNAAWLAWDYGTVRKIARAIYYDRAFDRLPILADALEDAGCTDKAILDHCRQPGEHERGCWVVDLLLGKE
jgi:hypothetical protein